MPIASKSKSTAGEPLPVENHLDRFLHYFNSPGRRQHNNVMSSSAAVCRGSGTAAKS
jgi:hypothetical protein